MTKAPPSFSLAVAAVTLLLALPATAANKSVHIVEAQDASFAALLIAAYGAVEPVLLFEPADAEAVRETAESISHPRTCVIRAKRAGTTAAGLLAEIAGQPCETAANPAELALRLWSDPKVVVAYRDADPASRVRAAGFAAASGAALLPLADGERMTADNLAPWKPESVYLASDDLSDGGDAAVGRRLVDANEILGAFLAVTGAAPKTLILTNPDDLRGMFSPSSLSTVAAVVAAVHRSPVFAVPSPDPEEIERFANRLMKAQDFLPRQIVLVGDELAMRSHRIPDPVLAAGGPEARGGGTVVRVEIFSEIQRDRPQQFPVGRIVAENSVYASLSLARGLHVRSPMRGKPVIFLANADEVFALGETISRTTVDDLRNIGVPVRSFYRDEITPEISRQALASTDVLVWEGHPRDLTLEESGGVAIESAPRLVILQGCYTLDRNDPMILIEKGTQAIVATSAAIYSAPGSGFARALIDAIAHEDADLGTAVRNARNYLLALAQLKRARKHKGWEKTYRAALAFALWGDPTYRVVLPAGRPDVRPITWTVDETALTLTIPRRRMREIAVDEFRAAPAPRAMLGGIVDRVGDIRTAWEMFGTTRVVPPGRTHVCPPSDGWTVVSMYAPATETLTMLALPQWNKLDIRTKSGEFRFRLVPDAADCDAPES
jgi:hypothetical protein